MPVQQLTRASTTRQGTDIHTDERSLFERAVTATICEDGPAAAKVVV
ncbi:hypothetical protein K7B10_39155 [Streptomyces flavotricini]|uniref:Uncharacterized protein n=1 Tax=Streptomyces flavotricini TaxID=66888 RepID=A0ABS8EHP5_9ACTN|nr:hypothetical protein [Streptomyces flavotricini]MCC0100671.1 hypothetical protein [Streptomyces flavotricini]